MNITVKGMMCHHCETHVAEADIKTAVEAAGYEYGGII